MPTLFDEESDQEDAAKLNINTDYAKNYDSWRQKEELHKLQARYGEDAVLDLGKDDDDDESSSSSDDEGEEIPEEFEKNFYKTLACLKNKDPKIYNKNVEFFNDPENEKEGSESKKKKKEKALTLRDYERKIIVEKGGKLSDSEDEGTARKVPRDPTYVEEQQALKNSLKSALEDDSDGDDDLLKPKTKSAEEKQKEEKAYKEWLKGQAKEIDKVEQEALKPLRDYWTDPKLDKNEKFLRDYILNKKFLGNDDLDYEHECGQRVHDSDENLSEDEKNISKQEEFEHKYNFRYEEPDPEFIKRYPRTMEGTLRKKESKRSDKRAEVKARKEQEKLLKREELKQLKALKRKEIEEKLEKLKEVTGNDDIKLDVMDLDGDFDPEEYDKKMNQMFNDDYYAEDVDEMKPECPEIDEELEVEQNWDNYDPNSEKFTGHGDESYYEGGQHCEDPEFNMDADYDGQKREAATVSKKKCRRGKKFAELISKEKPKFDPKKYPKAQEYYDQYYALDYEDMIGDLPCRFKYRETVPNDYGLTVEEILLADDRELNKWSSLKRALQRKEDAAEYNDVKRYKQRAANEALKRKIIPSLYKPLDEEEAADDKQEGVEENGAQKSTKKKRRRKKKTQEIVVDESNGEKTETVPQESSSHEANGERSESDKKVENNQVGKKNKKKRKHENTAMENNYKVNESKSEVSEPTTHRSLTNGEAPAKKKKNKDNSIADGETSQASTNEQQPTENGTQTQEKKKKKKNKKKKKKPAEVEVQEQKKKKKLKISDSLVEEVSKKKGEIPSKQELRKEVFKKRAMAKLVEEEAKKNPILQMKDERLKAYGIKKPSKFKNKLIYGKKDK